MTYGDVISICDVSWSLAKKNTFAPFVRLVAISSVDVNG